MDLLIEITEAVMDRVAIPIWLTFLVTACQVIMGGIGRV